MFVYFSQNSQLTHYDGTVEILETFRKNNLRRDLTYSTIFI